MASNFAVKETFLIRWTRRLISISVVGFCSIFTIASVPFWLLFVVLFDLANQLLLQRKTSATRGGLFIVWLLLCECYGLLYSAAVFMINCLMPDEQKFIQRNYQLQAHWASLLWLGATRLFQLQVVVDDQAKLNSKPFILLLRHVSIADTLLASIFISVPYQVRFRYVLKRELLWDPCLDIVGQRVPNYFVDRAASNTQAEIDGIARLSRAISADEGLLIYPEGTRFSESKRQRIIQKLQDNNQLDAMQRAEKLLYTLPPKVGGVHALLEQSLGLDVVIAAHTGLEKVTKLNQLYNGAMLNTKIDIRFQRINAQQLPIDKEACAEWLYRQWLEIDQWVARHLTQ